MLLKLINIKDSKEIDDFNPENHALTKEFGLRKFAGLIG